MKKAKNALKTRKSFHLIYLLTTGLFFFAGCKKTESDFTVINWDKKKVEIANKVKSDLINLKTILPYTISRVTTNDISFDNQKINEYYNISNLKNTKTTISRPKNVEDLISSIKAKQLSSLTPISEDPNGPPETDPLQALLGEGYRNQYLIATQSYGELSSYLITMDGIASDMLNSIHVTDDEKVLMYTEIEFLKQFATDLETNPDYWIDLYAPLEPEPIVASSRVQDNTIMSTNFNGLNGKTIMGPPYRPGIVIRRGCKVNTRAVLMSGVIAGFVSAVGAAKVGAVAGTVTVPGVGTVTGAVSGFMAGFAAGFVGGIVTGVIGELALTCGR